MWFLLLIDYEIFVEDDAVVVDNDDDDVVVVDDDDDDLVNANKDRAAWVY